MKLVTEASGLVDHVVGDTVTATFGVLPGEEAPEVQAVWAARRILDEVGALEEDAASPARIGIGIASGTASYGIVGIGGQRSFSALGHRVNTAARLESQAWTREILIDETTHAGLSTAVQDEFQEIPLAFRGEEERVRAFACGRSRPTDRQSTGSGIDLPAPVVEHLRGVLLSGLTPGYLALDAQGCVQAWGGALESLGIPAPRAGQAVGELLLFLEGFFPLPETMSIPAMALDSGRFADVHLFEADEASYVLLLDVTEQVQAQQLLQQRGVDLGILAGQLEQRNSFIQRTFGRYLSEEIVEQILDHPEGLSLEGETRAVTIMMTDLRGFTSMCERLTPEQVVRILNHYLGAMTEVIQRHEGTIDEFIGDAILVLFGAPLAREDDARRAIACATEMMLAMDPINDWCRREGLPVLEMGIGLNTGDVIIGNIGSERRLKYGVVGSNVNLAARIESYTVGGQILASARTVADAGPEVKLRGDLEVSPKGVPAPITVHDVAGIGGPHGVFLPEADEHLVVMESPLLLSLRVISGKDVEDTALEGRCLRLSRQGGIVAMDAKLPSLTNLVIGLRDVDGVRVPGDLYGKVMEHDEAVDDGRYIRFTAISPLVEAFLQDVLG